MSDIIGHKLGINCSALMGANIAHEVADEEFCEATIGLFVLSLFIRFIDLTKFKFPGSNCTRLLFL